MNHMQNLKNSKARASQSGFTIIELVVVILLLGILAATALPRFMDVTDEAHAAAHRATVGGFATGVGLFHAQWVGNGQPGDGASNGLSNFGDGNVLFGPEGFPASSGGVVTTDTHCVSLFDSILQGGNAGAFEGIGSGGAVPTASDLDYTGIGSYETSISAPTCYYVYIEAGSSVSAPFFTYNATTGDVINDGSVVSPGV